MTWRESVNEWFRGYDPIHAAIMVAKKSGGELTPGDCLRLNLIPQGYDKGNSVSSGLRMSEVDPKRIERAKFFINQWKKEMSE